MLLSKNIPHENLFIYQISLEILSLRTPCKGKHRISYLLPNNDAVNKSFTFSDFVHSMDIIHWCVFSLIKQKKNMTFCIYQILFFLIISSLRAYLRWILHAIKDFNAWFKYRKRTQKSTLPYCCIFLLRLLRITTTYTTEADCWRMLPVLRRQWSVCARRLNVKGVSWAKKSSSYTFLTWVILLSE